MDNETAVEKPARKRQPGVQFCRNCNKPLKGVTRLMFSATAMRGSSSLCLSCVEVLCTKGVPLSTWVKEYIESQKDPVRVLRDRVAELEKRLSQANNVIDDFKRISQRSGRGD